MEQGYEGWKNRATWNCALTISNDYGLYTAACEFMQTYKGKNPYLRFVQSQGLSGATTPDGFKWDSNRLDYVELNDMMREFSPEGTRV